MQVCLGVLRGGKTLQLLLHVLEGENGLLHHTADPNNVFACIPDLVNAAIWPCKPSSRV